MRCDARWLVASLLSLPPYLCPVPARTQADLRPLPPLEANLVGFARDGAMRRLRVLECQELLHEFHDQEGHPLARRLESFAVPPDRYLAMIPLLDGRKRPLCKTGHTQLLATRGVARVLVCEPFLQTVFRERESAELHLIHEMLHTLGLGESPPTSQEIAQRVKRRCAP